MGGEMLDYREEFFYNIVKSKLGYTPSIEIKPAHLANGFFRAVCGRYVNNEAQHWALYPKGYPPDKIRNDLDKFSSQQQTALLSLLEREQEREMLFSLLAADRTVFRGVSTSSYSLSHASHITNDNHDRDAGMWLYRILEQGSNSPALELLGELLIQEAEYRNDELSVLTLPLDKPQPGKKSKSYKDWSPGSLQLDENGQFQDPIVISIRQAFDQLAQNDAATARQNGKLDTLRRFTTLACFSLYLHLANVGNTSPNSLVPMILRFDKNAPTLHRASVHSYQWILRSIDEFMRYEISCVVKDLAKSSKYGAWSDDADIESHIYKTINWYRSKTAKSQAKEESKVKDFKRDCWRFYRSYRGETAEYSVIEAFSNAATDMLGRVLSSKPQDIMRALGTRIGLLGQFEGKSKKSYLPQPDYLEVLVRATLPKDEVWTLRQLAEQWAQNYGILFGILGDENDYLHDWGIPAVDRGEFVSNVDALAELLEMSGYGRRYADGVVLVTIEN